MRMNSIRFRLILFTMMIISALPLFAQQDVKECTDPPLFSRLPDHWIHHCKVLQFDAFAFKTGAKETQTVEGEVWDYSFYPKNNLPSKPSELQILRNYENAVQKMGGTTLFKDKNWSTFRMIKDNQEIWVQVSTEFTGKYRLVILKKAEMKQQIVMDAQAFLNDINASGHAAVYGIYFDTGKATIKPESEQAIAEIAKLLTANPALNIYVVGHTDNEGGVEANLKLSKERADAVIIELVTKHKMTANRMLAYGCGLFAPVATNATEEGRALNRRVELVKQ